MKPTFHFVMWSAACHTLGHAPPSSGRKWSICCHKSHLLGIWTLHHSANSPGSSGATGRINHSLASCCYGKSTFFPNCPFWTNFALREVSTPPITEKSAEVVGTSLPCAPPLLIDLVMVGWSFRHPFYLAWESTVHLPIQGSVFYRVLGNTHSVNTKPPFLGEIWG